MSLDVLVTGATGYIGGRLTPGLVEEGYRVRCFARDPAMLLGRNWSDRIQPVQGNALDELALDRALRGVHTAFYLIHSMSSGADFEEHDRYTARLFGMVARRRGVRHIIYLGGLGDDATTLSPHLRSRHECGRLLRMDGVPVTEFRAAAIIGSGSLSFEMVRALCERLPLMLLPKWTRHRTQPISVRDVLSYLNAAVRNTASRGEVIEIGGRDVLTYSDMLRIYNEVRGLTRIMIPVPVLTPMLSSYWMHLVTPVPASVARPLVLGLAYETVQRGDLARRLFPGIRPMDYRTAVSLALNRRQRNEVATFWTSALSSAPVTSPVVSLRFREGMYQEQREHMTTASPEQVFATVEAIGGDRKWPMHGLWALRGAMDVLVGGRGLRRGRRDPDRLLPGDALDFWRVETVERPRLLRLRAEMRMPGVAWLQWEVFERPGGALLRQTAFFDPRGVAGYLYWWAVYPLHVVVFGEMVRQLTAQAEKMCPDGDRRNLHFG